MRYLSLCSGIEAASCAWGPLGWAPVAFSEIEAFPSAVLDHHYPDVPNWGDMTKFRGWPDAGIDVLVGGTPCQSFSIAGLRKGMDDPRGNLALTYLAIADRYRPRWLVWENVPGVLSSDEGRALGSFLGGLGQLGYGFAYRVLDAQYFRLAQRRRRVFVVGYLGDWRRAGAVLLEPESMSGNSPPSRQAGQGIASPITPGSPGGSGYRNDADTADNLIAHALRADGFDASEDGTGRATPLVAVAFGGNNTAEPIDIATAVNAHGDPHGRLDFESETFVTVGAHCFDARQSDVIQYGDMAGPLDTDGWTQAVAYMPARTLGTDGGVDERFAERAICDALHPSSGNGNKAPLIQRMQRVRRLTPRECERLQGFKDDYTLIRFRRKPAADGPRYKAIGNSMPVPVMEWLGRRIDLMEKIMAEAA